MIYYVKYLLVFAAKEPEYYFTQKLPPKYDVKRKKTGTLECFVSDPRAFVKWYRNGEPLEVGFHAVFCLQCVLW
jgi:hypothetical protein